MSICTYNLVCFMHLHAGNVVDSGLLLRVTVGSHQKTMAFMVDNLSCLFIHAGFVVDGAWPSCKA